MDDKFKITITIANMTFPVVINRSEEELYRKAAKEVNIMFAKYKERYKSQETMGDAHFLSFVAFRFAMKFLKLNDTRNLEKIDGRIEEMTREVEEYLNNR